MMRSNGELKPCELWPASIGNVRDVGYRVDRLWRSDRAEAFRAEIRRRRCTCTHECFVTLNILFGPRFYPRLLYQWARLRIGAWMGNGRKAD